MYNVIDVAKYIILFCKEHGYSINNLKLQKLLYFVQAQFLIFLNKPAFEENIETWDIGQVVPAAYQYFAIWVNAGIPSVIVKSAKENIYECHQKIIDEILQECAPYSASYLLKVAQQAGSMVKGI